MDLSRASLVALSRASFGALRGAMFRDLGLNAASVLQEAGYAGGAELFDAFAAWLSTRGFGAPETLAASDFAARATEFFGEIGWGSLELSAAGPVATIDSSNWAEADPAQPMEFPCCYYTSGALADFFGRLAGQPLAVMEVECRSSGQERCRFLVGSGDVLQAVYDGMGRGESYLEVLGAQ